jgi:hypothetical protein
VTRRVATNEPAPPGWLRPIEAWSTPRRLGLAFLVCLLPRAAAVLALGVIGDYRVFADPGAKTESWWYPLYGWLAETLWGLSAGQVAVHVAWHLAIHSSLGPLTYAIARRLRLGALAAWLAVFGVALLPYYLAVSARQPQVGVVIAFVALLVWGFLAWRDTGWGGAGAVGFAAASGTSAFLRPNLLLTEATLYGLALLAAARAGNRRALARILGSGAGVALVLVAAAAVARLETGHWTPFQPLAGYNLWLGHNPRTGEYLRRWDALSVEDAVRDHGLPPEADAAPDLHARDAVLQRLALEFIRENPGTALENTLWKAWRWWDVRLEDAELNPWWWNLTYTGPYLAIVGLAAVGAWRMLRTGRGDALGVIAAVVISYWIPHLVLFPTIRMRMTTEFLLILVAAYGAASFAPAPPTRASAAKSEPAR